MDKLLNFVKTNKEVTIVIVAITTLFGTHHHSLRSKKDYGQSAGLGH
jgi:hypothetical protein